MSLEEKLTQLLGAHEHLSDPQERLAIIVECIAARTRLPAAQRTDENRVKGCISAAWITVERTDGRCLFRCAADSPLVAGLLACLCDFYSDATPEEVAATPLDPLASLGLLRNLSPTRLNGLGQAKRRIQELAAALTKSAT